MNGNHCVLVREPTCMAEGFVERVFGDAITSDRRLCIFTAPDLRAEFFADAARAAAYAREQAAMRNVYFGLGLIKGQPAGRGKAEDVAAIGALWADIDMAGPAHAGKTLPENVDAVRRILARLPHGPSMLVHSGHGVHAYWLFKEPWVFDDDAERAEAGRLAKGWHGVVCAAARGFGWQLENLGDLARVLRLPGTLNHKTVPPVEVRVIEVTPHARYNPTDFEPYLAEESRPAAAQVAVVLHPDAQPPLAKVMNAASVSPKFRDTWDRKRPDLADQSQSGYDLALASIAARLGWSDQEIADIIIAARRHHNQNPAKAMRQDYMTRTIARARASVPEAQAGGPAVDLSGIVGPHDEAEESPLPAACDPGPIPEDLLRIPGFVGDVMAYTLRTAPYPAPALAFCGALVLQAFLAGRKVRDVADNRANLYVLGLANSGAGKDHPRKVNQRILVEAGLAEGIGDTFASGEGIEDRLLAQPAMLFQTDEIDGLMTAINKGKDARHEGIMNVLLKMFTSAGALYPTRVKAGKDTRGLIDQPCLCIFGTAIPEHYYQTLSMKMLTNGFFARLLILEAGPRAKGQDGAVRDLPEAVVAAARWWAEFQPGTGNLPRWHPVPRVVEQTPEASAILRGLREDADEQYSKAEARNDLVGMAIWARAHEKARRLALVYACSENHRDPLIGADAARWAWEFVVHQTRRMLFMAAEHVSQNEFDADCKKLLRVLREWRQRRGEAWMPFWQINRKLPWSDRQHEEVRVALLNQQVIEYAERRTGGPSRRIYRLRQDRAEGAQQVNSLHAPEAP